MNMLLKQTGCVIVLFVASVGVAYWSPINFPTDSLGSLLTSQAIIQFRTVRLDAYSSAGRPYGASYQFVEKNHHLYHYFPLGTALIALPFVYIANLAGADMAQAESHLKLENILSALTVGLAAIVIWFLCRQFLGLGGSFFLTIVFVFGSTVASTMGTALWSINFATLFELLVLLLLVSETTKGRKTNSLLLGLLIFLAYLCRPSTAVFAMSAIVYLFYEQKKTTAFQTALVVGLGVLVLIAFSWSEYQQLFPDYYSPQRLAGSSQFWLALYGNLLSPARGLFVYSPYFLLTLLGGVVYARHLYINRLFALSGLNFLLTLITVSLFQHWWGGWSFGYRLLTDAVPALILLTLLLVRKFVDGAHTPMRRWVVTSSFIVLSCVSVVIHTGQGLYNESTYWWNDNPHIDRHPEYIFDWKYPQFLASPVQLLDKRRWYELRSLPDYDLDVTITSESQNVLFESWYEPQKTDQGFVYRWSNGKSARLVFKISSHVKDYQKLQLQLHVDYYREQLVSLLINGQKIKDLNSQDGDTTPMIVFSTTLLREHDPNVIEFLIPGAISPFQLDPANGDSRVLGILFVEAKIVLP